MGQKQNPAVARTPGLKSDQLGGEIEQNIAQAQHSLQAIPSAIAITHDGRLLGFATPAWGDDFSVYGAFGRYLGSARTLAGAEAFLIGYLEAGGGRG